MYIGRANCKMNKKSQQIFHMIKLFIFQDTQNGSAELKKISAKFFLILRGKIGLKESNYKFLILNCP